ncbi:MAG TPA: hypothetical protein PLL80_00220 [Candidatus Pacearchaeota archaeon]|nr:hypothetical protein [Candidatus Pacearchaeota archaeon]HOK93957.1 hypothetical protein [Candidatus Pacearchaeota archaeon]HPO75028.1 hypothetical protein [Candidatus Pacearchaeota archaeon]
MKINSFLLIFISFIVTILFVRINVFLIENKNSPFGFIEIKNIHYHHYTLGGFLLFILLIIYLILLFKEINPSKYTPFFLNIISGVSLALIFDEYSFWGWPKDNNYWSYINLITIFVMGLVLGFLSFKKKNILNINKKY